ncbi:Signal transduction histidine kinase [Dyadobacter koreensis]|uniref:Signal transduction histidine kinase n=1 Tax=Dyadobacter koreensis TaxID=408657 RepID=A0A1H6R0X5_9BACT|nr:Signal transduction histidine kinase [Dyadobacter koreensis]
MIRDPITCKRYFVVGKVLLTIIYFLTISGLHAQEMNNPDFDITHYSDENGLPQNSVKAITKDSNGFVWLATEDGLVRFDGQSFYTFNRTNLSITSNRIYGFVPSLKDYTPYNKDFTALNENLEYIKIRSDGSTQIEKKFLNYHQSTSPYGTDIRGGIYIMRSLPSIYGIAQNHEPFLYPAGSKKFYVWHKDRVEYFIKKDRQWSSKGNFKELFILSSVPYVTLMNGEFARLESNGKVCHVSLRGDILNGRSFNIRQLKYKLFWDNISQRAYVYHNQRFYSLEESADRSSLLTKLIVSGFDFDDFNIVTAHYDDKLNYLFLGSYTKGLFVLRRKDFFTKRDEKKGADNVYYAQVPVSDGSVLSTQGHIFTSGEKAIAKNYTEMDHSMDMNSKYFMAQNHDLSFWIRTSASLTRFSSKGDKILQTYELKNRIKALYADRGDTLWIGGEQDSLFLLNTKDYQATPKLIYNGAIGEISCISRLRGYELMLGTKNGLFLYNIQTGSMKPIKGLEKVSVRSIYESDGYIWITTYGDGIYMYYRGKATKLPLDKNQFLATSHCILEDKRGFFWITTNKGLFQVLKNDLLNYVDKKLSSVYYLYYDKRHGFSSNEFNGGCQPCGLKLDNGTFSFPSMDGFVWFKPDDIKTEIPDQSIFIGKILLDGKQIDQIGLAAIPRDFKQLNLSVSTPYFNSKSNLHITYSIQEAGQNEVWLPVSENLNINFPIASSGNYSLVIRKQNGFGADNYTYKKLKIFVVPAWYETWVFRALCLVLIGFCFLLILRKRTSYLLKKEREKNVYRQYHINNQIVTAINHDIQTPLFYISNSFTQIQEHLAKNNLNDAFVSAMSSETVNTIYYAREHTRNLLNYIKSQNQENKSELSIEKIRVFDIVQHSSNVLLGVAKHRDIKIVNKVDNDFIVETDGKLLSLIIQNLMDNAVKLSRTTVVVSTNHGNGLRQIIIDDTGKGIPDEIAEWLNASFKSYTHWMREYRYPNHKGLGLMIVKDMCILLNINVYSERVDEYGTRITLTFQTKLPGKTK